MNLYRLSPKPSGQGSRATIDTQQHFRKRIALKAEKVSFYFYKIKVRNSQLKQCNIADRWKQHVKCGLGIDASATNKLYNNMQKYGVWNFTFEILQKCTRDKLNEKERFWIQMYQSNKTGLNITKGNK